MEITQAAPSVGCNSMEVLDPSSPQHGSYSVPTKNSYEEWINLHVQNAIITKGINIRSLILASLNTEFCKYRI